MFFFLTSHPSCYTTDIFTAFKLLHVSMSSPFSLCARETVLSLALHGSGSWHPAYTLRAKGFLIVNTLHSPAVLLSDCRENLCLQQYFF